MPDVIAAGSLKIKSLLPDSVKDKFDLTRELDKDGVKNLISDIISEGGSHAPDAISNISREFFDVATKHGYSTPLDDYWNDSEDRNTMLQEFKSKVDQITLNKRLDEHTKNTQINELTNKYGEKLKNHNLKYLVDRDSTAAIMAQTGARGNPHQLMQGTASPLISKRIDGSPIPVAITKSYAEGLSPAEQLSMSYWGRNNTVQAQLSTSKPGALFKEITPNLYHEVVTTPDCHTTNGDVVPVSDKRKIMHRYDTAGRLIDEAYYKELVTSGKKTIKVRSTLTCEAREGVCQKCYGHDSRGHLPDIGENVGVLAAQSASEVLTQMILSTKHDAKAGKSANPYDQANNLLISPKESFQDKAIIATLNGKVDDIIKTPLNDHKVIINGHEHFVPRERDLEVRVGDKIKIGQAISNGTISPRELVPLRGIGEGRKNMADELNRIYENAGNSLDKRHFDLIAKNMIKHVRVQDSGDTGYLPGQVVNVNDIQKTLEEDHEEVDVKDAAGKMLSHQIIHMTPGTVLDGNHIDELKSKGIDKVKISKTNLSVEPFVPGLKSVKKFDENWVSKLTTGDIARSLKNGAALGQTSQVSSTDPIAAYVMGSDFGEGQNGRY